ncbi:hypothetical protein D3C81_2270610 [compost metagenome]
MVKPVCILYIFGIDVLCLFIKGIKLTEIIDGKDERDGIKEIVDKSKLLGKSKIGG